MIFALCSASLILCITLTNSQESVYSHLNVIFNEGARGTQCGAPPHPESVGAPALRRIEKMQAWETFLKNETIRTDLRQIWDLSHYCEKSPKAQSETITRKKWDLVKTRKRQNRDNFFFSREFIINSTITTLFCHRGAKMKCCSWISEHLIDR